MKQWVSSHLSGWRRIALAAICLTLIGGAAAYAFFGQSPKDTSWDQIQQTGTLRVGMDASYPPFETIDASGQPVGFDVDLANEIGRRLGIKVQITNIAYDGLYDALLTDRGDVLISALADLPQAHGKAVFSQPYFNAGEMLVVRTGSAIRSMDDLDNRSVAVEYGSGGDVEARKWQRRLRNLQVKRYPDPAAAIRAVSAGEADAAIVDGIAARLAIGSNPDLAAGPHLVDTLFAVAVRSENDLLRENVDKAINEMMQDGAIARLVEKWFGAQRAIEAQ